MNANSNINETEQHASADRVPRLFVRPAWMIGTPKDDWPEDAEHENGLYFNKCVCCACDFIGHKDRHQCHRCYDITEAHMASMTPEERAEHEAKRDAAIAEYLRSKPEFSPVAVATEKKMTP